MAQAEGDKAITDPDPFLEAADDGEDALPDNIADIHESIPTLTAYLQTREELFTPVGGANETGSVTFQIKGGADEVIDINKTLVIAKFRLVKNDGTVFAEDADNDKATVINGPVYSLFKSIDVCVNNQQVLANNHDYAYRGDIEHRVLYPKSYKAGTGKSSLYYLDDQNFETLTANQAFGDAPLDDGVKNRYAKTKASKIVTVVGHIHSEIFDQDKVLLPGTKVDINFNKNSNSFMILSKINDNAHKLLLLSLQLKVRFLKVDPKILYQIHEISDKGITNKYPIRRVEITPFLKPPIIEISLSSTFFLMGIYFPEGYLLHS